MAAKIAVVGADLSGLACAMELKKNGIIPKVFEKTDKVGGRVKTDLVDGFLLDHGFQVFLPSYDMGRYFLNYEGLDLKKFHRGARIHWSGDFHELSDPRSQPGKTLKSVFSTLLSLKDKLLILKLFLASKVESRNISKKGTALDFLSDYGFSE